jgi:hypothetical protein
LTASAPEIARKHILSKLKREPQWVRSFHALRAPLNALIAEGRVELCRPEGGRARNMVRLVQKQAPRLDMIDHFAERLSRHGDIEQAAGEIGQSAGWGHQKFAEICKHLGAQAS